MYSENAKMEKVTPHPILSIDITPGFFTAPLSDVQITPCEI